MKGTARPKNPPKNPPKQMRCERCAHQWRSRSGSTLCPKCGHEYVRWVNFDQWRKKQGSSA